MIINNNKIMKMKSGKYKIEDERERQEYDKGRKRQEYDNDKKGWRR